MTSAPDRGYLPAMPGWRDHTFIQRLGAIAIGALLLRLVVLLIHLGTPVPVDHEVVAHAGAVAGVEAGPLEANADVVEQVAGGGTDGGPPLWPAVRTMATLGLGGDTGHQLVAVLLGTLTVVLVGFAGYRLGGRRTGLVAAGLAAAYPGLWVYESAAMAESLLVAGVAGAILLAYAYFDRPTWARAAALGATAGALALVRTEQVLVLVALVLPLIAVRNRGDRRRLGLQAGTAVLALLAVVTPWWAVTTATHDGTAPISVGLGADLAASSCRPALSGPVDGLSDARCAFNAGTRLAGTSAVGDSVARDDALRQRSFELLGDHGQRLPFTAAVRVLRATGVLGAADVVDRWSAWSHQPAPVVWLWLVSALALTVLAVRGASALRAQRIPLLPLLAFVGVAAASAALLGGDLRYRAAAAVPLVLLGAAGLSSQSLAPPLQRRRGKLRPPAAAWRSSMPDDFWDELVERLARMDDDRPLTPSASHAPAPAELPPRVGEPGPPADDLATAADVIDLRDPPQRPVRPPAAMPDATIDLRDLPPPPPGVAPWPVPVAEPVGVGVGAGAETAPAAGTPPNRAADPSAASGPVRTNGTHPSIPLGTAAGRGHGHDDGPALRDLLRPRTGSAGSPAGTATDTGASSRPRAGRHPAVEPAGPERASDPARSAVTGEPPTTGATTPAIGLPLPPPPRRADRPAPGAERPTPLVTPGRTATRNTGARTGRTGAPPGAGAAGTVRGPGPRTSAPPADGHPRRAPGPVATTPPPTTTTGGDGGTEQRVATRSPGAFRAR